jgi:putative MATE family efflux protein
MLWGIFASIAFSATDTYFVSRLGSRALAAISFTFPVVLMFLNMAIGLGAGASSVLARSIGAGKHEEARRLASAAVLLSLLISLAFAAIGIATINPLFRLLGAEAELMPLIEDYMAIWYLGLPLLVVPLVAMAAARATGESRLPGLLLIGSALVNLLLDPLLIFGLLGMPRLEVAGAALATVIARSGLFAGAIWMLHRRCGLLEFTWPGWRTLGRLWSRVLSVGLPAAGTNMIIPLTGGVVVALVARFGVDAVAGFGAASRIEAVTLVVFYALSSVIGPLVGQNLGAGKPERVTQVVRQSVFFCFGFGVVAALILAVLAEPLAGLFSDKAAVVRSAVLYLWIVPMSYGGAGAVMVCNAAFNGLGTPRRGVIVSVTRMLLIYLPLALLGSQVIGLEGIFVAAAVANLLAGVFGYLWLARLCRRRTPLPAFGNDRRAPPPS